MLICLAAFGVITDDDDTMSGGAKRSLGESVHCFHSHRPLEISITHSIIQISSFLAQKIRYNAIWRLHSKTGRHLPV